MKQIDKSRFRESIRRDFEEWKSNGVCLRAEQMNRRIGADYFDVASPHYFTGDIESEIVMVHLNPKRDAPSFGRECEFQTFDDYWSFYERFGNVHYGPLSDRSHKSPFDHKQIRFLQPLGLIPFSETDVYENLRSVIDQKLQIELIPYGSPDFNFRKVGRKNIDPFVDDIIRLIGSYDRKCVLFCGRVFVELLKPFSENLKQHKFKIIKKDGSFTKNYFEVINIMIQHDGMEPIRACILPQYAMQGCPASQYGKQLAELYSDI